MAAGRAAAAMIDAYASQPHYAVHMAPILRALKELGGLGAVRATMRAAPAFIQNGLDVDVSPPDTGRRTLVASYRDLWQCGDGPHVFLEHGAGQTYSNDSPSYSGGRGRDAVELFVCPSVEVAARNLERYPRARAIPVGVPALDDWHSGRREYRSEAVAISFHWDCHVAPEARWAWPHYRAFLPALARKYRVIGHAHPRVFRQLAPEYAKLGIEPVESFDEVLARASVYVCDNSSTIFEFATTDRPVVLMNAPWYRRNVEHGLRFWRQAGVGIQVSAGSDLEAGIEWALNRDPMVEHERRRVVSEVYVATDGQAARRAAAAIEELG